MALTLAWVEREIEECLSGENTAKNVTDFAILCIAREHLRAMQSEKSAESKQSQEPQPPPKVILSNYCADLDAIPRVEQIGAAIEAAASVAYEPEEQKKIRDLRTWRGILSEAQKI